ncbi:MAG: GTPase [Syntrophobacteraceae bacterium]
MEAFIDFAEDLPEDAEEEAPVYRSLMEELHKGVTEPLRSSLDKYEEGRVLREGLTLVLVGKPNVGKSSMLNALLGKDRAIVTASPGTTRDVIEDSFLLSGVQVRILDTAGIRNQPDEIESHGIERTLRSVSEADVALWLIDHSRALTSEDQKVYEALQGSRYLVLLNKSDLPPAFPLEKVQEKFAGPAPLFRLSVKKPPDIDRLKTYYGRSFYHASDRTLPF